MDPNATIHRFCDACIGKDFEEAGYAIDDLHYWMLGGGFAPREQMINALRQSAETGAVHLVAHTQAKLRRMLQIFDNA